MRKHRRRVQVRMTLALFLGLILIVGSVGYSLARPSSLVVPRKCQSPFDLNCNLQIIKQQLSHYYSSGGYLADVETVTQKGKDYLQQRANSGSNLAIVLDIDETSLSNWTKIESCLLNTNVNRSTCPSTIVNNPEPEPSSAPSCFSATNPADPALLPTLALYRFSLEKNYKVFFVTGRPDTPGSRRCTEENLKLVGYSRWEKLYMKPPDYNQPSVIPYKSGARREITAQGYQIVLNMGDQNSDLEGGFARDIFKLPNPYYYIP